MVNRGRSNGCNTCKERRVKCDEGRPSCQRCSHLGRICGGYERKPRAVNLRFKLVESNNFTPKPRGRRECSAHNTTTPPGNGLSMRRVFPSKEEIALSFFLGPVAAMGRDLASTRGLFELVGPVLRAEPSDSAVSLAVVAVSRRMFSLYSTTPTSSNIHNPMGQALRRLQADIEDPLKSKSDITLLAILVLQFHENLSAVFNLHRTSRTHHDGALALLQHRGSAIKDGKYGGYLLGHVLHGEVSSAIREKRPLDACSSVWMHFDAVPQTPSSALDLIGVSVANLQHSFLYPVESTADLWKETDAIKQRLTSWLQTIPRAWWPVRLWLLKDQEPQISTYSGACDVYPSVQIAAIWNLWRCYRLIILNVLLTLRLLQQESIIEEDKWGGLNSSMLEGEVQEVVDAICASVPFFLGNRTGKGSIWDFSDDSIVLPYYQDIPTANFPQRIKASDILTKDEHRRHVMTQGAWHIMSTLSYLVRLFSEPQSHLLPRSLRMGQVNWIREQLKRVSVLMRLTPNGPLRGSDEPGPDPPPRSARIDPDGMDSLAERVRDGFRMTSGS